MEKFLSLECILRFGSVVLIKTLQCFLSIISRPRQEPRHHTVKIRLTVFPSYFQSKLRPLCIWIFPGRSALLIRILASYLGKILSNSLSSSGAMRDFSLDTTKVELLIHYFVSSFHQPSRKWPRFNRLSNRTYRRFVALTTVSLILNISNPSMFCPILNNSEHITVTFSPLSGSWNGWPRAPRSTSSRRPSAACGVSIPTAVASDKARSSEPRRLTSQSRS